MGLACRAAPSLLAGKRRTETAPSPAQSTGGPASPTFLPATRGDCGAGRACAVAHLAEAAGASWAHLAARRGGGAREGGGEDERERRKSGEKGGARKRRRRGRKGGRGGSGKEEEQEEVEGGGGGRRPGYFHFELGFDPTLWTPLSRRTRGCSPAAEPRWPLGPAAPASQGSPRPAPSQVPGGLGIRSYGHGHACHVGASRALRGAEQHPWPPPAMPRLP